MTRTMVGRCGLCQNKRKLRRSHCIPTGIMKLFKDYLEPIHIADGAAVSTSYESQKPFLCDVCEQRFNKLGENIVTPLCLKGPGDFPFRDKLRTARPTNDLGDCQVYTGEQLRKEDVEALKYFAVSVFWRNSATEWMVSKNRVTKNDLGSKYTEEFRLFLLGRAPFPTNAAIAVRVADDDDLYPYCHWPAVERRHGYHEHVFSIPGFEFHLYVGKRLPSEMVHIRKESPSDTIFFLEQFQKTTLFDTLRKSGRSAVAKGKLKDWLDKNSAKHAAAADGASRRS